MNEKNIKSSIKRISYEIVEGNSLDDIVLVGIHTRGVNIAERIRENILLNSGFKLYVNKLNPIHFILLKYFSMIIMSYQIARSKITY